VVFVDDVVVVVDVVVAGALESGTVSETGAALESVVVEVVELVVSDVAVVSVFFWQAPTVQAMPSARATARTVRCFIDSPPGCASLTVTLP
jgi:hypothetical protein